MTRSEIEPHDGAALADSATPLVSVITIFLDAERFLVEAIESVLRQDWQDFELLLVDDGSTDRSSEIALDYCARLRGKIRYLEHQGHANRGMSASRNLGISAARGEFLAFIDADDTWEPYKLSEQVAIMKDHPELGMICGSVRYWRSWDGGKDVIVPTGNRQNALVRAPEALFELYPLGDAAAPCPSDLLFRREAVDAVGGFEEQFTGMYEDQGLLAKLYLKTSVFFSDRVWLNYRQHADSCVASVKRHGQYDDIRLSFLMWFDEYLGKHPADDPRVRRALRRAFRRMRYPRIHRMMRTARRISRRILSA